MELQESKGRSEMEVAPSAMNQKEIATANRGSWSWNAAENRHKGVCAVEFFDCGKQQNTAKAQKG